MTTASEESQLAALRRELKIEWKAHAREHTQHEVSHAREHQFTADALKVAAELAKENKSAANEWREAMNDRERNFATKSDIMTIAEKLDKLEEAEIRRVESEKSKALAEAKEKADLSTKQADDKEAAQAAQRRSQWIVGIIVGLIATFGAILINTVIRLSTGP